ncbi:Acetylcholinesterase-1 [Araneus ventricosus]|uniref:Carboxylic ester hydrolase n=1 Tax=Araneus ventricosus TaxID=182803 RepID=A0A4Y2MPE9_ARAVE|nr:Acetylcholinesterase-1 [Araneus ventricosus]
MPSASFIKDFEETIVISGLWDILEGLRWVNKYIGYFGGDTSRITIAGQSAGAWSVGLLAVSPLAKGLYKRQIMESGSPIFLAAENNTQNLGFSQRVAEMVGCASPAFTIKDYPGPVVECLRNVDPAVLAGADYALDPHGLPTFFYQYGDEILPANPRISILKGDFRCTELLIGSNHDEGSFIISATFLELFGFFGEKKPLFNKTMGADLIRKLFKGFPDPESVVQHYLPDALSEEASGTIRYQVYTSFGDMLLLCPGVYHAEKCAEKGGNVYSYLFTHRPSNTPYSPFMGEVHFGEVQFVFGSPLLDPTSYTQEEQWISRQIIEIWSSFAKYG